MKVYENPSKKENIKNVIKKHARGRIQDPCTQKQNDINAAEPTKINTHSQQHNTLTPHALAHTFASCAQHTCVAHASNYSGQ